MSEPTRYHIDPEDEPRVCDLVAHSVHCWTMRPGCSDRPCDCTPGHPAQCGRCNGTGRLGKWEECEGWFDPLRSVTWHVRHDTDECECDGSGYVPRPGPIEVFELLMDEQSVGWWWSAGHGGTCGKPISTTAMVGFDTHAEALSAAREALGDGRDDAS